MKRLFPFFALLLVLPLLSYGQVQRRVMIEEFTNASCGPCASQNPAFDALLSANASKVVAIKYHTVWPGTDPMNAHNPTEVATRVTYYNVSGVPHATMDGANITGGSYVGAPANLTQAKINTAYAIPSPLSLTLSYVKSPANDTIYVSLKVKAVQSVQGALVAHIGIEEQLIHFNNPPGGNGEKDFSNVMIKMLPGAAGTTLPPSMAAGDSVVLNYFWKTQYVYDPTMLCVAAWVQNNSTKNVLQAAFAPPIGPNYLNATPTAVLEPNGKVCGNSIEPVVTIKNLSGIPLTSLQINYKVNTSAYSTYSWTGNLNFQETTDINLPACTFTPVGIGNKLTVYTSLPNGANDSIPVNDTIFKLFNAAPTSGPVTLELKTDNYPTQTTWKVYNSAGTLVDQGGPYTSALTTYTQVLNINANDCYNFVISDAGGNGICCNYGAGQYKLKNHLQQVFQLGAQFGAEETAPFKFDLALGIESLAPSTAMLISPNPFYTSTNVTFSLASETEVGVTVMNEIGQVLMDENKGLMPSGNNSITIDGKDWAPGLYIIRLILGEEVLTQKLTLSR